MTPAQPRDQLPRDVSGRALKLRDVDLDTFLHPRTVAVVGASEAGRRPNSLMTVRLKDWADRHEADFIPVNPRYDTVCGAPSLDSLFDVEVPIDLAVLLTGTERVVGHYEDAVSVGAKFAVIFSAGFAEVGRAGAVLEARLRDAAQSGSTHLLGPNTNLNAFSDFRDDLEGPAIALVTQSGHQGRPVFQGQELGIRLSHWAPTGNEVDLEFADFARYFADQPDVGVIAAYIEGFKDGRSLMLAVDHAARRSKPIVMVKVGHTDQGASMAMSHTGHLVGSDRVVDSVLRQFGVIRVEGLDELLDVSAALARSRPPRNRRDPGVAVYAISGGTGAHMADMLADAGLRLPTLRASTRRALHDGLIPEYLRVSNPVDCGGPPVTTPAGRRILELILEDPEVDILVVPITGALEGMSAPMTRDLVEVSATTDKPIFVVWGSPVGTEPSYRDTLLGSQLPVFRTFANCVRAVRACVDHWAFRRRYTSPFPSAPTERLPRASARARRLLARAQPEGALSEHDSKRLISAYGIRATRDRLCGSASASVEAARDIGLPVAMKLSSPSLAHKSELGLVVLNVSTLGGVRATYGELMRRAARHGVDPVDGVLVSEMADSGVEMIVGMTQDPTFGPVVSAGLGGVLVEALDDVAIRVPPFDRAEAERMLDDLRGAAILRGARGTAVDRAALVDVVLSVQRLALDFADEIAEIDINPLIVRRRGAVAADALVARSALPGKDTL